MRIKLLVIVLVMLSSPFLVSAQQKKKPINPSEPAVVKPKPAPTVVKEPESYSYLLVNSDLDVNITVNYGKTYRVSSSDEGKRVPLEAGENLLKITPLDGGVDGYTETIIIEKRGNRIYNVKLKAARNAVCSALVSSTERKAFMCYNLGSENTSADPLTPSWEIVGGYWQWGRKEMAAPGPSGPGSGQERESAISGWNTKKALDGSWKEGVKTLNDPCPSGYRVPTLAEWAGILEYNNISSVGTWEESSTNYGSGKKIGGKLFLPAAGFRGSYIGALSFRGNGGYYWSSAADGSTRAWFLNFNSGNAFTDSSYRTSGLSVRCIAE